MLDRLLARSISAGAAFRVDTDTLLDGVLPDVGDTRAKATAFWMLLACSSVIAAAGVVTDSTAVVIGAMVIAPLGTPIYGLAAAMVTGARTRPVLVRLVGGIVLAIMIGALVDVMTFERFALSENPQVLGRTSPTLADLLVALATGLAGSMALVRTDISPALPGVAIAISLVPPLTVVGITLAHGAYSMSLGAGVLFATNMMAIVLAGLAVFWSAGLTPLQPERVRSRLRPAVTVSVLATVLVLLLAASTLSTARREREDAGIRAAAVRFDERHDAWRFVTVRRTSDEVEVYFAGEEGAAAPSEAQVRQAWKDTGDHDAPVVLVFQHETRIML